MDNQCGCWAVLKRGVSGTCKSSASKDSANTIPRTSLVYDAGIYIHLLLTRYPAYVLLLKFQLPDGFFLKSMNLKRLMKLPFFFPYKNLNFIVVV